jgi:hypothetical protein
MTWPTLLGANELMPHQAREAGRDAAGRAYIVQMPPTCAWPSCWAENDSDVWPGLCTAHESAAFCRGCQWPHCPQDATEGTPWCLYHRKVAEGLIDPPDGDDRREVLLYAVARGGYSVRVGRRPGDVQRYVARRAEILERLQT